MKTREVNAEGQRREEHRPGRDCVTHMQMLRCRPDWLASALRDMGIGEGDDEVVEKE